MSDAALNVAASAPLELPIAGQPAERCDAVRNRRRILAAAREIVAEHGADGLSMNAVAAAAGVGKGTIFRRFGDRDGLLHALLDDDTIALQDGFLSGPPPLGPGAPADQRLEAFVVAYLRFVIAHLEVLLATERGAVGSQPLATLQIHIAALLAELAREDAQILAGMILGALAPRAIRRLQGEFGASCERLEAAALGLLHGVIAACRPS